MLAQVSVNLRKKCGEVSYRHLGFNLNHEWCWFPLEGVVARVNIGGDQTCSSDFLVEMKEIRNKGLWMEKDEWGKESD